MRGPLYHNDHGDIFGPALIDAYRLESKVARYPRILIADSALPCVDSERMRRFCRTARTDRDGLIYLDILGHEAGPPSEPRRRSGSEQEMLDATRERFNREESPRIKAKLAWMVAYLTDVVDELGGP